MESGLKGAWTVHIFRWIDIFENQYFREIYVYVQIKILFRDIGSFKKSYFSENWRSWLRLLENAILRNYQFRGRMNFEKSYFFEKSVFSVNQSFKFIFPTLWYKSFNLTVIASYMYKGAFLICVEQINMYRFFNTNVLLYDKLISMDNKTQ